MMGKITRTRRRCYVNISYHETPALYENYAKYQEGPYWRSSRVADITVSSEGPHTAEYMA